MLKLVMLGLFIVFLVAVFWRLLRWTCGDYDTWPVQPPKHHGKDECDNEKDGAEGPGADPVGGDGGGEGSGEGAHPREGAVDHGLTDASSVAAEAGVDEAFVGEEKGGAPVWSTREDAVTGEVNADWVDVRVGAVWEEDFSGLVVVDCEVRPAGRCADEKVGPVVRVRLRVPVRMRGFGYFHHRDYGLTNR